ncbi:MAG: winged helix-turn-helix transcriptional regulator [Candidatus Heimdallarchaeota archaeon]
MDRAIISSLVLNGRTTLKQLSEKIGFTSTGIKKRLARLFNKGILKVSALLNLNALKLHAALLLLELESGLVLDNYIQRFRECPRIVQTFRLLGGYNLALILIAENSDTLESITAYCPLRAQEVVRRSELYLISDLPYSAYLPVREHLVRGKNGETPCNCDCAGCGRYQSNKCVGCPASEKYRGTL